MGLLSYGYKASKTPAGKKVVEKVKDFFKPRGKVPNTITSVKPSVGKSKIKKAVDDVKLSSLKTKGRMKRSFQKMEEDIDPARKKLRQTTQKLKGEKVTESGVSKGKDLRENKMGGGMMGRRFGYKSGMSVKGDNKRDIRKTESMIGASKSSKREKGKTKFGMLSVKAGIDKNPNPTLADRIAGAKMKKGKA